MGAVIGGLAAALAAAVGWVLYFRSRYQRERDARVAANDARAVAEAERDDASKRQEAVNRVLRADLEAHRRWVAHLVRGNPDAARDFVRSVLDEASRDETPGEPDGPTGDPPKGRTGGGDN